MQIFIDVNVIFFASLMANRKIIFFCAWKRIQATHACFVCHGTTLKINVGSFTTNGRWTNTLKVDGITHAKIC